MSFANLEKVEVLGLPGVEGELRVRGDKTVTITITDTDSDTGTDTETEIIAIT